MSKLLLGLKKGENCALESPTGTGKSIAVLSAAMAWQKHQKEGAQWVESDSEEEEDVKEELGNERKPLRPFHEFAYVDNNEPDSAAVEQDMSERSKSKSMSHVELAYEGGDDDDDESIFQAPKKKRKKKRASNGAGVTSKITKASQQQHGEVRIKSEPTHEAASHSGDVDHGAAFTSVKAEFSSQQVQSSPSVSKRYPLDSSFASSVVIEGSDATTSPTPPPAAVGTKDHVTSSSAKKKKRNPTRRRRRRVPTIVLATRTLSQLNQLVGEVKACKDAETRAVGVDEMGKPFSMTLLSSRKHSCVNKTGEASLYAPSGRRLLRLLVCRRDFAWKKTTDILMDEISPHIFQASLPRKVQASCSTHYHDMCARPIAPLRSWLRSNSRQARPFHED